MVKKIKCFMEEHHMVMPDERVLLGVSGGADSVCLCLVFAELAQELGCTFEVVHVEHGIRGAESRRDAAFVQALCARLGILFHEKDVDVPSYAGKHRLGEEEAARILRYEAFAELANPGTKIAVAHHMEDNAETILFQMIRGSGLDGICGMQPVRTDTGGHTFIRPLLCVCRSEIEAFLKERGQEFCLDSTNRKMQYSRNRIRHNVLPELVRMNPQAVAHMNQTAARLAELREYMEQALMQEYDHVVDAQNGRLLIHIKEFSRLPKVLQTRLLHRAACEAAGAKKDISAIHLKAVQELISKQTGASLNLPHQLVAKRVYDDIVLEKPEPEMENTVCLKEISQKQLENLKESEEKQMHIEVDGAFFLLQILPFDGNFAKIPQKMYTKWFDYDKIKSGIFIRNRKQEDFFLLDKNGHHKKLKDYLTNEKIPASERDKLLLLARESQILWIIGRRMGYGAEITENTRTVLAVTWIQKEITD